MITILVIDFGCPNVGHLCNLIYMCNCNVIRKTPNEINNTIISNSDGIILSGGPSSVTCELHPTIDTCILESNIPILGICYGAQLIAKLNGGHIKKHTEILYGWKTIYINNKARLYSGLYPTIYIYCKHYDIITKVSDSFIITSYNCDKKIIMSFEHKKLDIYAV